MASDDTDRILAEAEAHVQREFARLERRNNPEHASIVEAACARLAEDGPRVQRWLQKPDMDVAGVRAAVARVIADSERLLDVMARDPAIEVMLAAMGLPRQLLEQGLAAHRRTLVELAAGERIARRHLRGRGGRA